MPWITGGLQSNPSSGVVLADTGARSSSSGTGLVLPIRMLASSSARVGVEIQHRNAANNANIWQHAFLIAADSPLNTEIPITIADGERVRVVTITAIASGQAQASLFL